MKSARSQHWPICVCWRLGTGQDNDEEGAIQSRSRPTRRDACDMAEPAVTSTWATVVCGSRRRLHVLFPRAAGGTATGRRTRSAVPGPNSAPWYRRSSSWSSTSSNAAVSAWPVSPSCCRPLHGSSVLGGLGPTRGRKTGSGPRMVQVRRSGGSVEDLERLACIGSKRRFGASPTRRSVWPCVLTTSGDAH